MAEEVETRYAIVDIEEFVCEEPAEGLKITCVELWPCSTNACVFSILHEILIVPVDNYYSMPRGLPRGA